jgi:hypothetical protein
MLNVALYLGDPDTSTLVSRDPPAVAIPESEQRPASSSPPTLATMVTTNIHATFGKAPPGELKRFPSYKAAIINDIFFFFWFFFVLCFEILQKKN